MALATIEDYFGSFHRWIHNPLYNKKLIRISYERIVELYLDRLFVACQACFGAPKSYASKIDKIPLETDQKQLKTQCFTVLTNKRAFTEAVSRDLEVLKESLVKNQKYFSKDGIDVYTAKIGLLREAFFVKNMDFDGFLGRISLTLKNFESGLAFLEAILVMKDDCDAKFKKYMIELFTKTQRK